MDRRFSCVIFDIDGTLTRTNDLIFATFNHVTRKYRGITYSPQEIIGLFGPPEEGCMERVFGPDMVDTVMEELLSFYRAHHDELAYLHPGIEGVLRSLRAAGVTLAIFTGKGRHTTAITLEMLGIQDCFDMVVSGNDVGKHKPDPEGIVRILERFQLTPDRALMVGDSMADVRAARGAGVPVAGVLWDAYDTARVTEARPDFIFHQVDEFASWCATNLISPAS